MDLTPRDAFADFADAPSALKATLGQDVASPLVTIAIPTFRRPDKLVTVVKSAVAQDYAGPVEIIIVDNDAEDEAATRAIIASLPPDPARPIRYYVNDRNIGMFGNWNRCIELARGSWVTILNDDDLLRPHFLTRSFRILDRRPDIDGLVCRKPPYNWDTGRVERSRVRDAIKWFAFRWRFDRHNLLRAEPRTLYFGNELDNGLGFLFKKATAITLGGYRQEEFPAADFFFYIRFCLEHELYWLNEDLAWLGIGENESIRRSTIMTSLAMAGDYYETMTNGYVPKEWIRLRPQLTANQLEAYRLKFGVTFTDEERAAIERDMGAPLPPPSFDKIRRFRLFNHGY